LSKDYGLKSAVTAGFATAMGAAPAKRPSRPDLLLNVGVNGVGQVNLEELKSEPVCS